MSVSANQKPVVVGTAVLSNGDLAVLAGNLYQPASNSFGFDDLQIAILANSTPDSLNQTTGNLSFASGGDSPNNGVQTSGLGNATQGGGAIAALPGGGMAVLTWGDPNLNYDLQILNNAGTVTTAPFVVHSQVTTSGNNNLEAGNPTGNVGAWSGGLVVAYSTDDASRVFMQRYTLAGVAVGGAMTVVSNPGGVDDWTGSMAVDSLGDVIFGFGSESVFLPGSYKMFNASNVQLSTPGNTGPEGTLGSTSVANVDQAPTFVPLSGGGFATVNYNPSGSYNNSTGGYPNFTLNVQTVSTTGAITTRASVANAIAAGSSYNADNVNWTAVLPNGTVEFQESRDFSTFSADTWVPGTSTINREAVTTPGTLAYQVFPAYGNNDPAGPAYGSENNVVGVGINSSNQLVGEGISQVVTVNPPVISGISPDTGTSSTDGITDTGALTVSGTAASGTTITLYDAGTNQIGTTTTGSGGTWGITLGTALSPGNYTLTATATLSGTTSSASSGFAVDVNETAPTVTSDNRVGSSPNNASSDQFTVAFSEAVFGVSTSSFSLADTGTVAGTIASVTGSGSSYMVTVNNVTGDGTMTLNLKAAGSNGIEDTAGNVPVAYGGGEAYTIEHTPPAVTAIDTVGSSPNNASSDQFTVSFSDGLGSVSGVSTSSFSLADTGTVNGTIASVSGSGLSYTVTVNNVTGDGTLGLDLKSSGSGVSDAAGNAINGGFTGETYTIEHTPPSVTSIDTVASSPNNASSDQFIVVFSDGLDSVSGVSTSSFSLADTGTVNGTIASVSGSGLSYTVTVNNVTGDGTLGLDLKSSGTGISDAAGNAIAGGFTGQTYTIEHTPPSVTSIDTVGSSPNNASSEQFSVVFSDGLGSVSGVSTSSFSLAETGTVGGTIASVSGSGLSYTVTVNGVTGDGTLGLDLVSGSGVSDAAGNAIAGGFTGETYTIEHTPPSVTAIDTVGSSPNNASSDQFSLTFSEPVTGVTASAFTLADTGTAAGTIASISGSGSAYTVTVNNVTGDGTLGLDLNSSGTGISDAAGNAIAGGFTGQAYTIEHTPPSVTAIDTVGSPSNSGGTEQFTVAFSESVTGVTTSDFTLADTGTVAGTIASISGSGASYTVTVTGVTGSGTMGLDLNSSGTGITDAAGNAIAGGFSSGQTFTITPGTATFDAHVYLDANGDGSQDNGETGLAGVMVNLLNGSGNPTGTSLITDSNGNVSFTGLAPGSYEISVATPTGDAVSQTTNIQTPEALAGGASVTAIEGIYVPATFSVHVYDDVNANGVQDTGDTNLAGVTVNLLNGSGSPTGRSTTTDSNGNASFTGLAPGNYEVSVTTPSGDAVTQTTNIATVNTLASGGSASATEGVYAPPALSQPTLDLTVAQGLSLGNIWGELVDNGVDPNPSSLSVTAVGTSGTQGVVTLNAATQTLTYLATGLNPSAPVDSFTYTLTDGQNHSVTGTVDVTITGPNLPTTVATTPGSTTSATGSGQRLISEGSGQTLVGSAAGGDQLFGGSDTTISAAGSGNTIYVEPGNHVINMGINNNAATLNTGNNTVNATGTGNTVTGGNGNDTVSGMTGSATITLGNGTDTVTISGANNSVTVGTGTDHITAGTGGNETVIAGDGANTVTVGGAGDTVTLGNGANKVTSAGANAIITTGNGGNSIGTTGAGNQITTGSGNDTIVTTAGTATIKAGLGLNMIKFAGSNNDIINQGGTDTLTDTGTNNTIVLPSAGNGLDTINGSVLTNGDMFDLRAALAATTWDQQLADIGAYLTLGTSGSNSLVQISDTSGGTPATVAVLNGAGSVSLSSFLAHALLT